MQFFARIKRSFDNLTKKQRRTLTGITAALMIVGAVSLVESPGFIYASATSRQLPIYSVERDQKTVSLSFDAAWGNDFCGNTEKA